MTPDARQVIFEVRAGSDKHVLSFGARYERAEAEELLRKAIADVKAAGGSNERYWIEEIDITGMFRPPPLPTPRQRYEARVTGTPQAPGTWREVEVEVVADGDVVARYQRNYEMLQTFEPFRQGDREYALVAPDYTATSVLDLQTGQIIASEKPDSAGFCPVGFYVPDWWDVHDGRCLPGSMYWRAEDHEWPTGDFGFVWGCHWADDSSWKIQYLDLSEVSKGIIRRDERFGYLPLATHPKLEPWEVIRCSSSHGERTVKLRIESTYDLATGSHIDYFDL